MKTEAVEGKAVLQKNEYIYVIIKLQPGNGL